MKTGTQELPINAFYFFIVKQGYYLKTKFLEDFKKVSLWDENPLFAGTIKNSDWIHYKIGSSWYQKQISKLHTAKTSTETIWYDVETLDDNFSSHIKQVKFGGKEKAVMVEPL